MIQKGVLFENPAGRKAAALNIWVLVVFALLFIVGVVERVYGIDRQSLWSDELYAVIASYKPFGDAWQMMLEDSHPPGYLLFMRLTLPIVGYSDFAIRLHALLFGIACIPLTFMFCRRWFSVEAALLATAVVVSANNAVYYSQEARAYSMLLVFTLLNIRALLELLFSGDGRKKYSIEFIVSTVLMLYLHYSGFVFLCAEILLCGVLYLFGYCKQSIKSLAILFGIPLLLYLPWFWIMFSSLVDTKQDWSVSPVPTVAEVYNTLQRLFGPDDLHMRFHVWASVLIVVFTISRHIRRGMSDSLLVVYSLLFLTVVPVLAFYTESLIATPIFEKRYFLSAMILEAMLLGWLCDCILECVDRRLRILIVVLVTALFTLWTINANVSSGLYSNKDKDPVREAVKLVGDDIKNSRLDGKTYTVITTHNWFDHYLRRERVNFDRTWKARRYYVPQQIAAIEKYLAEHKEITFLYYLALRQPNAEAAAIELKQGYKLLSQASFSIAAGTIDVFKFNVKVQPDAEQLKLLDANPGDELAHRVAKNVSHSDPSTYHMLLTHDWMLPALQRNGVAVSADPDSLWYVADVQADGIYTYVKEHPLVDTLYYFMLEEPNASDAALMLQARYRLIDKVSRMTPTGEISLLKFAVKEPPVMDDSMMKHLKNTRAYPIVNWLKGSIGQASPETVAVAVANAWIEAYLDVGGVPVDTGWVGRRYFLSEQVDHIQAYIEGRPTISTLYYVAPRSPSTEQAALALQKTYKLVDHESVSVAVGVIDAYRFDTRVNP